MEILVARDARDAEDTRDAGHAGDAQNADFGDHDNDLQHVLDACCRMSHAIGFSEPCSVCRTLVGCNANHKLLAYSATHCFLCSSHVYASSVAV